uniref:Bm1197 n=1 Tax=Brugia malayi TaxID=6279 RepID=A0A1I9G6R8_BRUMA|nr:Bm1197 [Brugia malayi]
MNSGSLQMQKCVIETYSRSVIFSQITQRIATTMYSWRQNLIIALKFYNYDLLQNF